MEPWRPGGTAHQDSVQAQHITCVIECGFLHRVPWNRIRSESPSLLRADLPPCSSGPSGKATERKKPDQLSRISHLLRSFAAPFIDCQTLTRLSHKLRFLSILTPPWRQLGAATTNAGREQLERRYQSMGRCQRPKLRPAD